MWQTFENKIWDFVPFSFPVAFYSRLGCNNCNNAQIWHLLQYFTAYLGVKDDNGWNILTFKEYGIHQQEKQATP